MNHTERIESLEFNFEKTKELVNEIEKKIELRNWEEVLKCLALLSVYNDNNIKVALNIAETRTLL